MSGSRFHDGRIPPFAIPFIDTTTAVCKLIVRSVRNNFHAIAKFIHFNNEPLVIIVGSVPVKPFVCWFVTCLHK